MKIKLRVQRFDPDTDKRPYFDEFHLEMEPTARVLDALHEVRDVWAPDLAFRRNCGHGICGSCAMRINNQNRLACRELVRHHGPTITVQPLMGLDVVRDLVVDMEPFFAQYRSVRPFLQADSPPVRERRQSPEEVAQYDDTTKCILCAACTTACPISWVNPDFLGPAAIVNAHRFVFDSRDEHTRERLDQLGQEGGVWRCRTVFNCSDACPRGIEVTKAIQEIRRALVYNR